jgi:hypothetical protein
MRCCSHHVLEPAFSSCSFKFSPGHQYHSLNLFFCRGGCETLGAEEERRRPKRRQCPTFRICGMRGHHQYSTRCFLVGALCPVMVVVDGGGERNNPFAGCDVVAPDKRTHLHYDLVELPRYRGSTTLTSMSHFSGDLDWTFTFPFSTSLISCRALGFYHNT